MDKIKTVEYGSSFLKNKVPLIVLLILSASLFLIPFKIISNGYTPRDDVLRHVAKAISGKNWHEILVLDDTIYPEMDTHPGWHFILQLIHDLFDSDADGLVVFSIAFLWLIVALVPLFYFERPEAFVCSLLLVCVLDSAMIIRFFFGRPFIFTIFTIISMLHFWKGLQSKPWPIWPLIAIAVLTGLASWIHSTWYLLFLPVFTSFFVFERRASIRLFWATSAGIIFGALLSMHPFEYLVYQINHLFSFLSPIIKTDAFTLEGSPGNGSPMLLILIFSLLAVQFMNSEKTFLGLQHPSFFLMLICWMLGLFIWRFWTDFGMAALLFWLALAIQSIFKNYIKERSLTRVLVVLFLSLSLFLSLTANTGNRWRQAPYQEITHLRKNLDKLKPWLPGDDGIIYSNDMHVFYIFFYMFPKAPWQYALGFEHTMMAKEDLEIFNNLRKQPIFSNLQPWVDKMTLDDRMILITDKDPSRSNPLPGIEWIKLPNDYWIGRIHQPPK